MGVAACQTPEPENTSPNVQYIEPTKVTSLAKILTFDYFSLATEIDNYFSFFTEDSILYAPEQVYEKYKSRNNLPNWIYISDTSTNDKLLNVLNISELHGLDREIYHYSRLKTNLENLEFFYFQTGKINYQLWAESEILLSDGLLLLAKHLKQGAFDPFANENYHYYIPSQDTSFDPSEIFFAEDLTSFMEDLTPPNLQYKTLQYEYLKRLRKPEKSRTTANNDTLNILRVNMERWRWNNRLWSDSIHTVYVNIPAFQMFVLMGDSVLMTSKVCVGKKRPKGYSEQYEKYIKNPYAVQRPLLRETPLLKNEISYIVLNPQWRVPSNIAKNEVLRNVQRDSSFLERMDYIVYHGNTLIDPYSVNWHEVSPSKLPYRFEQAAGEKNALGEMKFMFPNVFSVYLHDTPTKRDFARKDRAVSHGCVRVENYLKLANILLSDMPKYNSAYIANALQNNTYSEEIRPENIFLKTRAPIVIDYKTAWINELGELQIYSDVYDRDRSVLEALKKSKN